MSEKREYTGVDFIKLICAILVVAIHTEPFGKWLWLDRGLGLFTRLAVPYFFVVSGFFFFLPNQGMATKERLMRYIKRVLLLYGIWGIIYIPFRLREWIVGEKTIAEVLDSILKAIFIDGVSSHLWFFPALLFAIILIWFLQRVISNKVIIVIAGAFLLIGIVFSTYFPALIRFSKNGGEIVILQISEIINIVGTRNGLFYGFFFVALGAYFAGRTTYMKTTQALWLFFVSIGLLAVESYIGVLFLKAESTILWFSMIPASYALFTLSTNIKLPYTRNNALMLRRLSTLIYTSHYFFINCLKYIGLSEYSPISFVIVLITSLTISVIILTLSKHIKPLQYLY